MIPVKLGTRLEEDREWSELALFADLKPFHIQDETYLLGNGKKDVSLKRCLEMAQFHSVGYDYILGMYTGAFLWHAIFRLAGIKTPFIFQPCFNHVQLKQAYPMFLSSQLLLPHDILFAGSMAASRSCAKFGFHCDSLHPRGIDLDTFHPLSINKDALRNSLGLPSKTDILIYTGRLDHDKNILELLDIVQMVRQERPVELVICYHIAQESSYLIQCLRRAEKIKGVHFVCGPSEQMLVQYYNAADFFVSAAVSICETFGRSPVEAMACGTPPIVSAYDGFRETVPPTCGTLVPTTFKESRKWPNIQGFSNAILTRLDQDNTSSSENCISHVQQYERKTALQRMLTKLNSLPTTECPVIDPENARISLKGYPQEIIALFGSLEGEPIYQLVTDFLVTSEVPVQPSKSVMGNFKKQWFSYY